LRDGAGAAGPSSRVTEEYPLRNEAGSAGPSSAAGPSSKVTEE
jgi:hypothetical protein